MGTSILQSTVEHWGLLLVVVAVVFVLPFRAGPSALQTLLCITHVLPLHAEPMYRLGAAFGEEDVFHRNMPLREHVYF